MNNESVGKKIVEALKKQAANMDIEEQTIDIEIVKQIEEVYSRIELKKLVQEELIE